jgi:ribosomal protein L31E
MVQNFWKSVDKIVRHNYGVLFDRKRQQARAKKLENFVSKHLKLSVRVAEELNTKSFFE